MNKNKLNLVVSTVQILMMALIFTMLSWGLFHSAGAEDASQVRETAPGLGLGKYFVIFNAQVRSAVELERVSSPREKSLDQVTFGPELENTEDPFRPGKQYHVWVKAVNYTAVPQARILEVEVKYAGVTSARGASVLTQNNDIQVIVYSYNDDYETVNALGGSPGFGGAGGPLMLEGEESKIFLVSLKFGEEMPPGNWHIALHLR